MVKQIQIKQFLNIKVICWILFLLSLSAVLIARYRLLNIPLERDEGEYAYAGQLLLQGIPPYKLAYSMKLPGTYVIYALFMAIFGQSAEGIHLGFLIINLASIILIFFISKRLFGFIAGIFSAISYAVLSVNNSVLGAHAHSTHFVVAMALCGLVLLLKAAESEKKIIIFLSGLFFGLAFLMKQHGIFFLPLGIIYLTWAHFKKYPALRPGLIFKLITYTIGAVLPFAGSCLFLFFAGVFDRFWFWVFRYAHEYSSGKPLCLAVKLFKNGLIDAIAPFQIIGYAAVLGSIFLFLDAKARKHALLIITLLIASFLSVCPGLVFRRHYFVTILPVISILTGVCINSMYVFSCERKLSGFFRIMPIVLFTGFLAWSIFQQKHYFFESTPAQISRETYGPNPFIESAEIAKYLKANSSPGDNIAVLGSEPQIYFYSNRHSATGYIYTYTFLENQPYALSMQKEMIKEIEFANPKYLIFVNIYTSWLGVAKPETLIFKWAEEYIGKFYKIAGVVDIFKDRTDYYWDAGARKINPSSPFYVNVYERKID